MFSHPPTASNSSFALSTIHFGAAVYYSVPGLAGAGPIGVSGAFGDGVTSTARSGTHTYTLVGTHPATLRLTGLVGLTTVVPFTVTVYLTPSASGTASPVNLQMGALDQFAASSGGGAPPISHAWPSGGNHSSSLADPTHAFAAAGVYHETLWTNDSLGASVVTHLVVTATAVGIPPVLNVTISASMTFVQARTAFTLSATPGGGVAPYTFTSSVNGTNTFTSAGIWT